jgi:putative peptide zinc metalloprotease protein
MSTPSAMDEKSREQWLGARLAMRKELRFDERYQADHIHYVIEDRVRAKFFQIGGFEYHLVRQFDGKKTLQEILESQGDEAQAIKVAQWLLQKNLAYLPTADNVKRIEEQASQANQTKWMSLLNPLSFKITLFNPNRFLNRIQPVASIVFSAWFLLLWLVVGAFAASVLLSQWQEIGRSTLQIFSGQRWIWLMLAWIGLKAIHETAHGLACRKFGGEVPEAGVLFLLFTPMAYVNVTSMWRFADRWQRILVSIAGIYVELFLSFIALLLWHYYPGFWGELAFNVFVMASINTVLFNANPLMRFDGYFVLSDLLQIPNLYSKSFAWLGSRVKKLYFGTPSNPHHLRPRERFVFPLYGGLAWCWKITVGISLMIGATVLFKGAGIALAAIGFVMWYALPAWKHWKWFLAAREVGLISIRRMCLSFTATAIALLSLFMALSAPATKAAPAIVQFAGEQVIRAASSGFVKEILVQDGQQVTHGQPLLILENPVLALEVFELEQQILETTIHARIKNLANELAKAQAEKERLVSLKKQLAEKQTQLNALCITAPANGVIFGRGMDQQTGRFLHQGDEIFSFSLDGNKEILVSIDQRDWDAMNLCEGKPLRIAIPGQPLLSCPIRRAQPRASLIPPHLSLAASHGGALPVKSKANDASNQKESSMPVELLSPRFTLELELDRVQSQTLAAGQRGYVYFETKRQSMGSYLILSISNWIEVKKELAAHSAAF